MQKIKKISIKHKKLGMSLLSMLFVGATVACIGIVAARVVPTAIEYNGILKAVNAIKNQSSTPEIRSAFDRAAAVGYIRSISGKDLVITKQSDKNVVAFSYTQELPLVGPAYLLLKYEGKSQP